jgi:hypothetical protein
MAEVQEYDELYKEFKSARQPYEADWFLNMAFYQGDQWIMWNRASQALDRPAGLENRVTLTDNRILPAVDSRVARKSKQRPTFTGTPATADEADRNAALIAEQVLDNRWIENNLAFKFHEVNKMADICGAGFWKIFWDGTIGDKVEYYMKGGEPVTNNGTPIRTDELPDSVREFVEADEEIERKQIAQGDTRVELVSPFAIYPHPLATSLEDAEAIIEEGVRSKEYLVERFGEVAENLKPDTSTPIGVVESRQIFNVRNIGSSTSDKKGITVYELWERPCYSNEYKGRRAIWTKDTVLFEGDLTDTPYEECPYVMFSSITVPGRFWPTSLVSQLRGPQTELNKIISQVQENLQRVGNPSLMTSRHANIQYDGLIGERIYFDSTVNDAKPEYLRPPDLPSYLQYQVQKIEDSITEISGVHDVSKANVPAGVTAASAINLLQEADDSRLGPEIELNELSLSAAGKKLLMLMGRFADDGRIIRIAGEEGDWDIFEFQASLIRACENIEVQAGSTMPHSKAAKQAAMQENLNLLIQYGFELEPRSLRRFFKDFEVGGLEELVSNISNSELQVQREHAMMKQGQPLTPNNFDDNDFHIEAHEDFQRSRKYANLSPDIQELIQTHVDAHKQIRIDAINAQVQARQQTIPPEV